MTRWLLDPQYRAEVVQQHADLRAHATKTTAELAEAFGHSIEDINAMRTAALHTAQPPLNVVDGVARIAVKGPLLADANFFYDIFGIEYTTYSAITAQVLEAEASPSVASIQLDVNSPGGIVGGGLSEAVAAIASTDKNVEAVVSGIMASAAYWLGSQADTITATSALDQFGSIGVAMDGTLGADDISIASTDAPNKRPDLTTEEGRDIIRKGRLDPVHAIFVDAVAAGRGVSAAKVNADFGQGGTLLAQQALAAGMIDGIQEPGQTASTASTGHVAGPSASVSAMDLTQLKADHPGLYAQVLALGHAEGKAQEHARVTGHIKQGENIKDLSVAAKEIADPDSNPATCISYNMALTTKLMQADRVAANPKDVGAGPDAGEGAHPMDAIYQETISGMVKDPSAIKVH